MQPCAWQCHSFAACTTDHHCSPCHFSCLCSSSMCLTLRHTSVTSNETAVQSLCCKNDNNEAQRIGNEAFFLPEWPQKKEIPLGRGWKKSIPNWLAFCWESKWVMSSKNLCVASVIQEYEDIHYDFFSLFLLMYYQKIITANHCLKADWMIDKMLWEKSQVIVFHSWINFAILRNVGDFV